MSARTTLLLTALLAATPVAAQQARTESGAVAGTTAAGVEGFRGIPYAAPPTGAWRWRPPQPAPHWRGIRKADTIAPICMQTPDPNYVHPMSEDCLTLNIWRPAGTTAKSRLPVIVWIHGGAYVAGGSSDPGTWGDAFARRGVILVTFNYRLGRLGFFAHPALNREHPGEPHGNYGFMDQIAAFAWVKRNIHGFGGDPRQVTAMGESAGGESVLVLAASPMAKGLFSKAIVQSGGGGDPLLGRRLMTDDLPGRVSAEKTGLAFAAAAGITADDADALAKLRALPADKVADQSMVALVFGGLNSFSGPIEDGRIVTATPGEALKAVPAAMPLLIGTTTADLGLVPAVSKEAAFALFGKDADRARALHDPDGMLPLQILTMQIGADRTMAAPARAIARLTQAKGAPAWRFRFGYVAEAQRDKPVKGAEHSTDVAFAFGALPSRLGKKVAPQDQAVADMMQGYWVNFARTGDPNGDGLARWPEEPSILLFNPDGTATAGTDPWQERLDMAETRADPPRK